MSTPKDGRFSRAKVRDYLAGYKLACERSFLRHSGRHIDLGNGTAQLEGLDEASCAIYGEWRAARRLLGALDLGEL